MTKGSHGVGTTGTRRFRRSGGEGYLHPRENGSRRPRPAPCTGRPTREEPLNLDALVAPLRADVVSGASVVARTAAEVVRRAAVRVAADDVTSFRGTMSELAVRILDAQPAMAPLVYLGRVVLEEVAEAGSLEKARGGAARVAEDFRSSLDRRTHQVGSRAAAHLPARGTVVTLSSSSTVKAALAEAADRELRVVCLESRPMNEGRMLARALAETGLEVTYALDAAAGTVLQDATAVLLGADSIGDRGVVNKLGSALLAREAARSGIPVIVTADRTKFLPPGFPQPTDDDRPADEVWKAPSGVEVLNRYFEVVSAEDVSVIVTEDEDLGPEDSASVRSDLSVPVELRTWAEQRSG